VGVEDQGLERRVGVALRSRDALHHRVEQLGDPLAGLGRDAQHVGGGDAEHPLDLARHPVGVGRRQVDLVERGDDREVVLEGGVAVGEGLGLDALGGVDEQDGALAGGQAARDLVAEVDVAGRVDQVEDVVLPAQAHVLRLDRDPALALELHGVEVLRPHLACADGVAELENAVSER
jgi:hypothetical protein